MSKRQKPESISDNRMLPEAFDIESPSPSRVKEISALFLMGYKSWGSAVPLKNYSAIRRVTVLA